MHRKVKLYAGAIALFAAAAVAAQGVPTLINYQGRLLDGGGMPVSDASLAVDFSLWDQGVTQETVADEAVTMTGTGPIPLAHQGLVNGSELVTAVGGAPVYSAPTDYLIDYANGAISRVGTGAIIDGQTVEIDYDWMSSGNSVWSESQLVEVTEGIYNVQLGAANPLPIDIFSSPSLYLELAIGGEALSPRTRLTSIPYAMNAALLDGLSASAFSVDGHSHAEYLPIAGGTVSGDLQINGTLKVAGGLDAPGAIDSAAIADGSITLDDLAPDSVDGSKIVDESITGDDIANSSITTFDIQNYTITDSDIATNGITSANIKDMTITGADIQDNTIQSSNIKNFTITNFDIAPDAITNGSILDGTITGADIMNDTLGAAQIADIYVFNTGDQVTGSLEASQFRDYDNSVYYIDPANSSDSARLYGDLIIGDGIDWDDDYIKFDGEAEYLCWNETEFDFVLSEDLQAPSFKDSQDPGFYVDPGNVTTSARLYGDLVIGDGSSADSDFIYFDQKAETLVWNNTNGQFTFSSELSVIGDVNGYRFVDGGGSFYLDPGSTLTSGRLSGNFEIGSGVSNDDDYLYFDQTNEHLMWDDANGRFTFSADVYTTDRIYSTRFVDAASIGYYVEPSSTFKSALFAGSVSIGNGGMADDDYLYFDMEAEYLKWEDASSRFYFSDDIYTSQAVTASMIYDANNPSYYIDPASTSNSVVLAGDLNIGNDSGADDDYVFFDMAQLEYLRWNDSASRFNFSDDLQVDGTLTVSGGLDAPDGIDSSDIADGTIAGADIANDALSSTQIQDIYVFNTGDQMTGTLDVPLVRDYNNTAFYLDPASATSGSFYGNLEIGEGNAADDDYIYFDVGTEYLVWRNANYRFEFSDDIYTAVGVYAQTYLDADDTTYYVNPSSSTSARLEGSLIIGYGSTTDTDYLYFDRNYEYLAWMDASSRFYFSDDLYIAGTLSKAGGSFKIDHPLDPENKYLAHSFVESPDMMNVYNGNVVLDESGEAVVEMPEYFEALNRDFRYQLTCIGAFAPVYVAEEIRDNAFKIAGGEPGMKVSWQVTGVRQDPWAEQNRIQVEEEKGPDEKGRFLHPEVYGHSEEMGMDYQPPGEDMEKG